MLGFKYINSLITYLNTQNHTKLRNLQGSFNLKFLYCWFYYSLHLTQKVVYGLHHNKTFDKTSSNFVQGIFTALITAAYFSTNHLNFCSHVLLFISLFFYLETVAKVRKF